jgi:polyphosphate glucokinase
VKTLVIDVGGTNIKLLASGRRKPLKIPSGPRMTPGIMVREVRAAVAHWTYDVVTVGYPGPVSRGRIVREPWNLGAGWVSYDFTRALHRPVRIINDAAMQALGSYDGGRMLFLGLGTGLGSAMIRDGMLIPMELAHLPYRNGRSYEEYLGEDGMHREGKQKWRRQVANVTKLFMAAFEIDYVVYGGGNARHLKTLPPKTRLGSNANAFTGGFRLWKDEFR